MTGASMPDAPAERPTLAHIAERVINRPLLILPEKAAVITEVLGGRVGVDDVVTPPSADRFRGNYSRGKRGYALTPAVDGTAIISIVGSLVNRGAWIGTSSGLVSYEGVAAQLRDAAIDRDVHSIVLDIDSPGGEALGVSALSSTIREIREEKRVVAVVNDMAASAGYHIASSADEIVISETSITGSIGVVMMHQDVSGKAEQEGIAVTLIYAGDHKVDGHPFGPLPDEVRADMQREVARHYDLFLNSVAAGRGDRLSADGARATQARVFIGAEAIEVGLADRVASLDDVLADLAQRAKTKRKAKMNDQTTAREEGAAAATARIQAILSLSDAKWKPAAANLIAFETTKSVEEAKAALASMPNEKIQPNKSPFGNGPIPTIEERMAGEPHLGVPLPAEPTGKDVDAMWERSVAENNRGFEAVGPDSDKDQTDSDQPRQDQIDAAWAGAVKQNSTL